MEACRRHMYSSPQLQSGLDRGVRQAWVLEEAFQMLWSNYQASFHGDTFADPLLLNLSSLKTFLSDCCQYVPNVSLVMKMAIKKGHSAKRKELR